MSSYLSKELLDFIDKHEDDDLTKLILTTDKYSEIDMSLAIRQIKGRKKIKHKVPEWYACNDILYPVTVSLEQSSSYLTAQYKSSIFSNSTLIDLTGGMGVDSYYFSQTNRQVTFVEKNTDLCQLAKHNFKSLRADNIEIVNEDALTFLSIDKAEDNTCFYIDPSRRNDQNQKMVLLEDCEPKLSDILNRIKVKQGKMLMLKTSPLLDIKSIINQYRGIKEVHCLAVKNECKELLFVFDFQDHSDVDFYAVNLHSETDKQIFQFTLKEELEQEVLLSEPKLFLYEPNAAIMKTGGYKSIAKKHALSKLHSHTHLYTSDKRISNFPGRSFKIKAFSKANLKSLRSHLTTNKANLTVRNFPATVASLKGKLKLKDGGETYLFACTLKDNSKGIIITEKVKD